MDKPTYRELRQITRHGSQTLIDYTMGAVTGDFYAVVFFAQVTTNIYAITIDNQVDPPEFLPTFFTKTSPCPITLYNVQSIHLKNNPSGAQPVCIAYTAPPIT